MLDGSTWSDDGTVWEKDATNLQMIKGPNSDALCNGVYITPLRWVSEYGRLVVVLVSLKSIVRHP